MDPHPRETISNLIKHFEDEINTNVVSLEIPKDLRIYTTECFKKCVGFLYQAMDTLDEGRVHITNRAREELSFEQHTAIYTKVTDYIKGIVTAPTLEEKEKVQLIPAAANWAEKWLTVIVLQEVLKEYDKQEQE
jgi:hypothetical protein